MTRGTANYTVGLIREFKSWLQCILSVHREQEVGIHSIHINLNDQAKIRETGPLFFSIGITISQKYFHPPNLKWTQRNVSPYAEVLQKRKET